MRPGARMPKLTRRSRILIGIALAVIALLLVGPRLVDAYVDWLWFGEVGFRSVWVTVLLTRVAIFVAVALVWGVAVAVGVLCGLIAQSGCSAVRALSAPNWYAPDSKGRFSRVVDHPRRQV